MKTETLLILSLVCIMIPALPGTAFVSSSHGVINVPSPQYPRIQDAVDAAHPGDTVLVSPGVYPENIRISKSLNLTGMSMETTVIDAQRAGAGVTIVGVSLATFRGFTVNNTGDFNSAVVVDASNNVLVFGNRLVSMDQANGTYVYNSNAVIVHGNVLEGNENGVAIQGGSGNTVRQNRFSGNVRGVAIFSSTGNMVQNNNVTGNTVGIMIERARGNIVKDNILRAGNDGLRLRSGAEGNIVARNVIANNSANGISLLDSTGNRFLENNVEFNRELSNTIGIYVQRSRQNMFYYNNIRNNTIHLFAVFPPEDMILNLWDDGVSSRRGNFWGGYAGEDNGAGGRTAGDGVGDTLLPQPCPNGGQPCSSAGPPGVDSYPLVAPWLPPSLNVTAVADRTSGFSPLRVVFSSSAVGGSPPYVFSWEFGTGDVSSEQNATFTFQDVGGYVVTLVVTDSISNSRSDLVAVTVLEEPGQPAGDGALWTYIILGIASASTAAAVGVLVLRRRRRKPKAPAGGPVWTKPS